MDREAEEAAMPCGTVQEVPGELPTCFEYATSVWLLPNLAREDGCSAGVAASWVSLLCSDARSSPGSFLECLIGGDGDGDLPSPRQPNKPPTDSSFLVTAQGSRTVIEPPLQLGWACPEEGELYRPWKDVRGSGMPCALHPI